MKKVLVLTLALALVPAFSPAEARSLTLAQRVSKLEAKLKCIVKTPVSEFASFANYGEPVVGQNAANVYTNGGGGAPDQLTDLNNTFGLDWDFGTPRPTSGSSPSRPTQGASSARLARSSFRSR